MKKLFLFCLLTLMSYADPKVSADIGQSDTGMILQVHLQDGREMRLLTPWDPRYVRQVSPTEIEIIVPLEVPLMSRLLFLVNRKEIHVTPEIDFQELTNRRIGI